MINTIAIAIGLLFMLPARAMSQKLEHPEKNANELARSILQNEVKAEVNDHSHWMFNWRLRSPGERNLMR
jgi:hypothetical protein